MMEQGFFIEVGSSDWGTCIPLAKRGWKGIIVEPLSEYLDNVERIDGVIYENVGLSGTGGIREIVYFDMRKHTQKGKWLDEGIDYNREQDVHAFTGNQDEPISKDEEKLAYALWMRGLGTMVSRVYTEEHEHWMGEHPEMVELHKRKFVKTISLNSLIEKHWVRKIDFLKMDCEGMEHEIITNYDWSVKPRFIKMEYVHINDGWDRHDKINEQVAEVLDILSSVGYMYWFEEKDIYAIL